MPIFQYFAVTGSVNQFGEVQPVGGLNEKIEGFFDACEILGLNGKQGILLPHSNIVNLMLNQKILDAVQKGQFHIFPVKHVNEALAILTGEEVGSYCKEGYSKGSIFAKINTKLAGIRKKHDD